MKYGDILYNEKTGQYAVLQYSLFGGSLHIYDEELNALCKTQGDSILNIIGNGWTSTSMPEGYEWDDSGMFIRKVSDDI